MDLNPCSGCSQYVRNYSHPESCAATGIGTRYKVFKEQCCPCTLCLVKVTCGWENRNYPFPCEPFRKSRQKLFRITNSNGCGR